MNTEVKDSLTTKFEYLLELKKIINDFEFFAIESLVILIISGAMCISAIFIFRRSHDFYLFVIRLLEPQVDAYMDERGIEQETKDMGWFSEPKKLSFLWRFLDMNRPAPIPVTLILQLSLIVFVILVIGVSILWSELSIDFTRQDTVILMISLFLNDIIILLSAVLSSFAIYYSIASLVMYITASFLHITDSGVSILGKVNVRSGIAVSILSLFGSVSSIVGLVMYLGEP